MVIYDQFHWLAPDHLEVHVSGTKQEILEQYGFFKDCYPDESIALATEEWFDKVKPKT